MNLEAKWDTRQMGLELVSYVVCLTTAIVAVPLAIKAYKFSQYGLDLYSGYRWPKTITVQYAVQVFWQLSVWPVIRWLPLTLAGDTLLRRFIYDLRN